MTDSACNDRLVKDIACSLGGTVALNVFPVDGGRNSRIYRVESNDNSFALKFFRADREGRKERFEAETTALAVFDECGIKETPRIIAKDRANNCVLMEWISGERVENYGPKEAKVLVSFIQKVHAIAHNEMRRGVRNATEACLNAGEIIRQINLRLDRLDTARSANRELDGFICNEFKPALDEISVWSQEQYEHAGLNFDRNIAPEHRTLSVVDFGFHNVLRKQNEFYFLDFEFFGWDDPVKLAADTLQHPGMALDGEMKQILFSGFMDIFEKDETFLSRFKSLYPLFGLKWSMIMLNQFVQDYKKVATRDAVGNAEQLNRVKKRVRLIVEHYREMHYGNKYSEIC